jgi:outer membrane protein assembly factor BamB
MARQAQASIGSSRREFLGALAGVGAASIAGPVILGATDKAGTKRPVIGTGPFTYEVYHDWGELPAGLKYGNTHGVVEDSQGQIYVHHTVHAESDRQDTMVVFDEKGKFVRSWGPEYAGGAHGLHIRSEGRDEFLYLCDTKRATVSKVTLKGEIVWQLGYPKESPAYPVKADGTATKYSPTNVAIAPNGDVYVGDGYGSSFINRYDAKGTFIRTFAGKGSGAGLVDCPHGMIVDSRSGTATLLVADRSNRRLQRFSLAGDSLSIDPGFAAPCHFSEHKGFMVVPDLFAKVVVIDRNNTVVAELGDNGPDSWKALRTGPREGFPAGKFVCPHGAAFDRHGNIFVVEWVEVGRVTKLRKVAG